MRAPSRKARCPGTQPGNGVRFGQNNYIGGSCMGIGDAIEIGQMSCPADQVQIQMTAAACGQRIGAMVGKPRSRGA